jgi:DNA-binding transcriptional LysR family regulator
MALTLDDIKYFIVLKDTLNITRASEIIGITQPTMSYAIKRLENELKSDLITRQKNGIRLTKFGEEFYKRAKRLELLWEESQKILSHSTDEVTGEFSFGTHPSVAIYFMDKVLSSIHKSYPLLDIKLDHGLSREMTTKVINWEIDFGIVINPIEHPDLVIREINKDLVTLFATKKTLAKKESKLIFDPDLAQSQFILKSVKKNISYNGFIHSGNLEVVAKLASQHLGYGLLPTKVANQYTTLLPVPGAPSFKDRLCLVYRKEKHQNEVSQKIINLIRDIK